MKKFIQSTFTAIALGLLLSIPYAAPLEAAAKFDDSINLTTIPKLPTCNPNNSGSSAAVSDYNGSVAWGSVVGTGGGTGVARVYCDGATWTVFAGGSGNSNTVTTQAVALNAPTTTLGNYSTGSCTGTPAIQDGAHSCLTFDEHWTASTLNLNNWFPGLSLCKGNADAFGIFGQDNCYIWPGGGIMTYPVSTWCLDAAGGGCFNTVLFDQPYAAVPNVNGLNLNGFQPMVKVADGSLALATKFFYPLGTGAPSTYCTTVGSNNCGNADWIGSVMTAGGITNNGNDGNVVNVSAIIPPTGGLMQFRSRFDTSACVGSNTCGLTFGLYPGMECDAVGGNTSGESFNANFEWGHNNNGADPTGYHYFAPGINNHPTVSSSLIGPVSTGDTSPTGTPLGQSGTLNNWHTYAIEWQPASSSGTFGTWRWYFDGTLQATQSENQDSAPIAGNPTKGFNCKFYLDMGQDVDSGFHTTWPRDGSGVATHPGPFFWDFSDFQVYKRPGT